MRELRGEVVAPPQPERYAVLALASDTAVTVKLNLVEPLLALRDVLDGEGVHGSVNWMALAVPSLVVFT